MSTKKPLAALITAAGMSTRMHDFKQTMKLGDKTFIEHIVNRFIDAEVDLIVVVAGYRAEEVRQVLKTYPVIILENPDYETTQMFDTVRIGLSYLNEKCERVFLTPVDIPLFTIETLRALKTSEAKVAIPVCEGETGHPVLIDSTAFDAILKHSGENGLRGAFQLLEEDTMLVNVHDRGSLIDADTQEDYQLVREMYENKIHEGERQ